MIRVMYSWQVQPGCEDVFVQGWVQGTNAIRATIKGARESGLWQHRTDPSVFMALTRWDKFEDWWAVRQGEPPHHDAFRIVSAVSDLDSVEMCYEGRDVGIPQALTAGAWRPMVALVDPEGLAAEQRQRRAA